MWILLISFVGGGFAVEWEIERKFQKQVEADRVSRYIGSVEIHHEELLSQVNSYALAVHHSHAEEVLTGFRNSARESILRLSQTLSNWEDMVDGEMNRAIRAYSVQLGYMQTEIAKEHDGDSIAVPLKLLSEIIQSRRALANAKNRAYLDVQDDQG